MTNTQITTAEPRVYTLAEVLPKLHTQMAEMLDKPAVANTVGEVMGFAVSMIKHHGSKFDLLDLTREKWGDEVVTGSGIIIPGSAVVVLSHGLAHFAEAVQGDEEGAADLDGLAGLLVDALAEDRYNKAQIAEFAEALLAQAKALPAE